MRIGLLMVANENDILERTLNLNAELVDCFFTLDGGDEPAKAICEAHPKHAGYLRDGDLDDRFPANPVDGYRQALYELAAAEYGRDNWFLLLHGDEVWTGMPADADLDAFDGFMFRLPVYFPRQGEPWDYTVHPLDQLRWHLGPGYPEFRMFHGGTDVNYDPHQHNNITPSGLSRIGFCDHPIRHYLYRSPEHQHARAARHARTGFDPGNYQHISQRGETFWSDEMIDGYMRQDYWRNLAHA